MWSGLETPGMKEAKCSLLLPRDAGSAAFQPKIKPLPAQRVLVYQDKGYNPTQGLYGGQNFNVDFPGCTILQLEPVMLNPATMPVTLTVGGKCHFTLDNYKDFRVMMRTKEQSQEMNIAPNGNFDWPDVHGLMVCPVCGTTAEMPSQSTRKARQHYYWMLFYPLMQIAVVGQKMTVGTRTICRLTCVECFKSLIENMTLRVTNKPPDQQRRPSALSWSLPVLDVLEEAGSISFLGEGPPTPRPKSHPCPDDIMDAWTLYNMWEQSGAWEALQNDYRDILSRSMNGCGMAPARGGWKNNPDSVNQQPMLEMKLADRYGTTCDNVGCDRIHGKPCPVTGERVRLNYSCEKCKGAHYCSAECRTLAATEHQNNCVVNPKDSQREETRREVQCDTCKTWHLYSAIKKCSRCKVATYCSVECQKRDWKKHKPFCKKG